MDFILTILAAALLGSMLFFPVVIAPMVFSTLPADQAGSFLRSMFPRYYLWGIGLSLIAVLVAIRAQAADFFLLSLVLVGFVISREVLMPGINDARDQSLATGDQASRRRFQRLHNLSVVINIGQIGLLVLLLVRHG